MTQIENHEMGRPFTAAEIKAAQKRGEGTIIDIYGPTSGRVHAGGFLALTFFFGALVALTIVAALS